MISHDLLNRLSKENRELIQNLNNDEEQILRAISKQKIMKKSNFTEKTIERNIPPLRKRKVDVRSTCHSLNKKGILQLKRAPDNWKITKLGYNICDFFLRVKYHEQYGDIPILKHGIIIP